MRVSQYRQRSPEGGFTLIDMLFTVALIGLLSSMAAPALMRARGAAQASSALATMRTINSGELSFAISCGAGFYAADLPTLGMPPAGATDTFLPPDLTSAPSVIKGSYTVSLAATVLPGSPATCNGLGMGSTAPSYAAVADPLDPATQLPRYFGTNADGVIYEHSATLSAVMPESGSPPIGGPVK